MSNAVKELLGKSKALTASLTIKDITEEFIDRLGDYGAFIWHQSKTTDSFYIKFRDERLGSIRISDHPGRTKLKYRHQVIVGTSFDFDQICEDIIIHVGNLEDFDSTKFIVFDPFKGYANHGVNNMKEYEAFVMKRGHNKKMKNTEFQGWMKNFSK